MSSISSLNAPVTVGIVGLGRAGWILHLEPMSKLAGFKIVAVADPLADRCREAGDLLGCAQFSSIDELLEKSDAQLIVVATPSFTHYSDVLKVLKAGRHCIAEKPLAFDSAEADGLVSLAREKGRHLFVNHSYLHQAAYYHLKGVIDSGVLGGLFSVHVCWAHYARRWDWQALKKNGGGQLNNTCSHVLSQVLPLLDSPVKRVFADLRNIKDAGDAEDHVHVVLQAESGVTADIIVSSAMALSGPRWILCGPRGTLVSDGETSKLRFYDATKVRNQDVIDGAAPGRQYIYEQLPWEERELKAAPAPVKTIHGNILDVLAGNAEPVVTPESAAEVVRVMNMIKEAAR